MEDYQAKYERLLNTVLNELNKEVLTAQSRAEKNAEASTSYCSELKKRLQESQREAEEGRERLKEVQSELAQTRAQLLEAKEKLELHEPKSHQRMDTDQPIVADSTCMSCDSHMTGSGVIELLSRLSGLSVSRCQSSSEGPTYHCQVTDGVLKGHTFTLSLNSSLDEFTYHPLQTCPLIPPTSALADTTCFPDYMQSRFLLNLLNTTFQQSDS